MTRRAWMLILGAALIVGVALSPLASSLPDGLDSVAEHLGFAHHAVPVVHPLLAEYSTPIAAPQPVRTAAAGLIGTAAVFALSVGAAWLLRRRGPQES